MKYHLLGLASTVLPYNSLLCRYTDPDQIANCRRLEKIRNLAPNSADEFMCGPFTGPLPDPLINGYEALTFDTLEAAAAKIQLELAAGSNYQYAILTLKQP
jgi:hypothetical protein